MYSNGNIFLKLRLMSVWLTYFDPFSIYFGNFWWFQNLDKILNYRRNFVQIILRTLIEIMAWYQFSFGYCLMVKKLDEILYDFLFFGENAWPALSELSAILYIKKKLDEIDLSKLHFGTFKNALSLYLISVLYQS